MRGKGSCEEQEGKLGSHLMTANMNLLQAGFSQPRGACREEGIHSVLFLGSMAQPARPVQPSLSQALHVHGRVGARTRVLDTSRTGGCLLHKGLKLSWEAEVLCTAQHLVGPSVC